MNHIQNLRIPKRVVSSILVRMFLAFVGTSVVQDQNLETSPQEHLVSRIASNLILEDANSKAVGDGVEPTILTDENTTCFSPYKEKDRAEVQIDFELSTLCSMNHAVCDMETQQSLIGLS